MRLTGISVAAALLLLSASHSFALTQADLDEPLANFMIDPDGDFVAVCRALHTGCGIETLAGVEDRPAFNSPLPRAGRTAREILDEYVGANPHDEWALVDGVLNLRPSARPTPDLLSKKTGPMVFNKSDGYKASLEILRRTGAGIGINIYSHQTLSKPVDRTLKDMTVRQGLNAIAKDDGEFIWIVLHSKAARRLVFRVMSFRQRPARPLNEVPDAMKVGERAIR